MMNLNWRGKTLPELDYEETVEFEKEVLKRIVSADRAGMSDDIIAQLQRFLDTIRMHKAEKLSLFTMGLDGSEENTDKNDSMIIGEPKPEPESDED